MPAKGAVIVNRIERACRRSYRVCEECGKPGRTRPGGYIQTLCGSHAKRYGYVRRY